jgi:integrase
MLLYATGIRRSELVRLRVEDIDSKRMIIHIRQGKGGKDRDVALCPKLLETLREYWRWRKPKTWLFGRGTPHAAMIISPDCCFFLTFAPIILIGETPSPFPAESE